MTTNKKRPSDLSAWDGDLSANLHVHRPGSSMKVSLQEIVDAVPVPDASGGGLTTGDIIQKPTGTYDDYFECDGSIKLSAEAPALAAAIRTSVGPVADGYSVESGFRYQAPYAGWEHISDMARLGGYTLYKSASNGLYTTLISDAGEIIYSGAPSVAMGKLFATSNAMYAATTSFDLYLADVLGETPSFNTTKVVAAGSSYFTGIVSVKTGFDLVVSNTPANFYLIDVAAGTSVKGTAPQSAVVYAAAETGGRIFAVARVNSVTGLYEIDFKESIADMDFKVIEELNGWTTGVMSTIDERNSKTIYFGRKSVDYCYHIETGSITSVDRLVGTFNAVDFWCTAKDNVLIVSESPYDAGRSFISFDYGKTWQTPPDFGAGVKKYRIYDGEIYTVAANSDVNLVGGTTGTIQTNAITYIGSDHFKLPALTSKAQGHSYYVKK